jgi:hypothetical protein
MALVKELLSGQQKGLKRLVTAPQINDYIRDTTPHMYVHMYYHSTGMRLDEYYPTSPHWNRNETGI